ncbi:hypothetical protein GmHk_08G023013 [Glycine max]|nr:hypothetical protein GmHk_08G023013 [Glycine max]
MGTPKIMPYTYRSKSYKEGDSQMWDIGGDEWDPLEGAEIIEVATLSLDELDLEAILFTDYGQKNDEIETI